VPSSIHLNIFTNLTCIVTHDTSQRGVVEEPGPTSAYFVASNILKQNEQLTLLTFGEIAKPWTFHSSWSD